MAGRGGRCSWGAPGRAPWSKTRAVPRQMRAASKSERGRVAPRYPPRPRAPDGPPSPSAAGRAVQRRRRVPMSTRAARPPPGATAFPGGANACTRPRSQPGRNVRRGHERVATRRPPGCTHRIGTTHTCHPAPHWRSTRALCSGRVARAHGSVRAWECDSDRGPWAALTRSTGRSSIVAWSSTRAAGRCRARFARSLGNDPETATINGCRAGLEH